MTGVPLRTAARAVALLAAVGVAREAYFHLVSEPVWHLFDRREPRAQERYLAVGRDELLDFLFLPGFSTADTVTEVSGRGVGLDVVYSTVHSVGGSVRVTTKLGQGTSFHLQLPITLL